MNKDCIKTQKGKYPANQIRENVRSILENSYKLDINMVDKIIDDHFADDFLPKWYFIKNSPAEIARQIFVITQILNANREYIEQVSDDGKTLTYFQNIGRDFPGRLARIIEENLDLDIVAFDSVKTRSGIRIISVEKSRGDSDKINPLKPGNEQLNDILDEIKGSVSAMALANGKNFIRTLPVSYLLEEVNNPMIPRRVLRHLELYESTVSSGNVIVRIEETGGEIDDTCEKLINNEIRISIAAKNPDNKFPVRILDVFDENEVIFNRTYFDTFEHELNRDRVLILSIYVNYGTNIQSIESDLKSITISEDKSRMRDNELEKKLETIVRRLSDTGTGDDDIVESMDELRELVAINTSLEETGETGNFLLNCISDFIEGARYLGIDDNNSLMRVMLGFNSFDEFFITCKNNNSTRNIPGFRTKHNSLRGVAFKGGLRIDPIVKFVEVAALAFMMTWKCARSRILFGGSKGGLMINPKDFMNSRIDFFDTLTNFGRQLFLVTGPAMDVPAGDVGCGADEIGDLFEGFKSALRDLALMAYGIKKSYTLIGNRVISVESARDILSRHFDIDCSNRLLLHELVNSENYLELVAAAQITGKPRMGIEARTGATGLGLCYSILAAAANMYFDGRWECSERLSSSEEKILKMVTGINGSAILQAGGSGLIPDEEWEQLESSIFVKLLRDKRVVVQGSGKVGSSVLKNLSRYGVNVIAVADAGGAVIGDHLDIQELLREVEVSSHNPDKSRRSSIVGAVKNIRKHIYGTAEGASILGLDCDILVPAALENSITAENASDVKALIQACGSNGANTSKAEKILNKKGVTVVYDFLANQGGVNASYFEWLRNLTERFRYESEIIYNHKFDIDIMDSYIMPEFNDRIKGILLCRESTWTTREWNLLLRDILFSAVNEDYIFARNRGVSMKTAGFINTQLRVLAAYLMRLPSDNRNRCWNSLPTKTREEIGPFLRHPETNLINSKAAAITQMMT